MNIYFVYNLNIIFFKFIYLYGYLFILFKLYGNYFYVYIYDNMSNKFNINDILGIQFFIILQYTILFFIFYCFCSFSLKNYGNFLKNIYIF